ncbi:hypothetical protein V6N00_13910 [Tersicoccus sp. MR15.9]|uniref:hypothetical protein n=1 Tax=Tersicoccus mangrovi TaxID=3121635 RepID=UPI002FE5666B
MRKNLDLAGRHIAIDRIHRAAQDGVQVDDVVEFGGEQWRVYCEPIRSPITRTIIGVLAIYTEPPRELPEKPVVGALEWAIYDQGRRIETVWDDNVYRLYGVVPAGRGSATGDMAQWLNTLVAPEDRIRMKLLIDGNIARPGEQRTTISYRIFTGIGTDSPGSRQLEAWGKIIDEPDTSVKWLRSLTREISSLQPAPLADAELDTAALISAAFALTRDQVLLMVDTSYWQTFSTSSNWGTTRLLLPRFGYLPNTVHPDDFTAFSTMCVEGNRTDEPLMIRWLCRDGQYRAVNVTASNGHTDGTPSRYVIVSLAKATFDDVPGADVKALSPA